MNKLPSTRSVDIVVQQSGKEILIYDLITNKAYNLNETSSIVYQACDGTTTLEELKHQSKFTDDIIFLALDELKKERLLEENQNYDSPFKGMNRRQVIRKVGFASMIALPVISSIIAPTSVSAQSCQAFGQSCNFNNGTQSNCCDKNARCINSGVTSCTSCLTTGNNTNCTSGAGCCTAQLAFFSNSCCNGVTETFLGTFPQNGVPVDVYRCLCS